MCCYKPNSNNKKNMLIDGNDDASAKKVAGELVKIIKNLKKQNYGID